MKHCHGHCHGHFKVSLMTEIRRVWKMKFTSKSINWQIKIFTGTRFNFYLKILSINSFTDPLFLTYKTLKN